MLRKFILALVFAATALPATAQDTNRQKLLEAMLICANGYPDMTQVRQDARAAGFRSEGRSGGFEFYTAYSGNIIFAASHGGNYAECGFGESGLFGQEAVSVVENFLTQTYGSGVRRFDISGDPKFIGGWLVGTDRGPLLILVRSVVNMQPLFRGSLIFVTNEPLQ